MWIIIHLGLVLTVVGTLCQQIILETQLTKSACTTGIRTNTEDRFFVNGTVAVNVADYLASGWSNKMFFIIYSNTSDGIRRKTYSCHVSLSTVDCNSPDLALPCYCSDVNPATGQVHFVMNLKALVLVSKGIGTLSWKYNESSFMLSNNITLPGMYDLQETQLNLTVYGVKGELTNSGSCRFSLTLNKSNHLRLCCFNTPTPCYPKISFGADVVSSDSCVSYPTSPLNSDGVTRELVLSFSACNKKENTAGYYCKLTTTPDVYVAYSKTAEEDSIALVAFLSVVLVLLVIAIIFGIACNIKETCEDRKQQQYQ